MINDYIWIALIVLTGTIGTLVIRHGNNKLRLWWFANIPKSGQMMEYRGELVKFHGSTQNGKHVLLSTLDTADTKWVESKEIKVKTK